MESLVSLKGYDEELQAYLLSHRYPAVIESLLTGIIVMMPEDPWKFLLSCLNQLFKEKRTAFISRVRFVTDEKKAPLLKRPHCFLGDILEEMDLPPQEVMETVFEFRKLSLQRYCFRAWKQFSEEEKKANEEFIRKLKYAKLYYNTKIQRSTFEVWKNYSARITKNRQLGTRKMQAVCNAVILKTLFYAWLDDYKEVRKARHWSKMEGTRDNEEADETWCWPEGEDPVSLLPDVVVVKVFGQVGLQALCRCAQVCRSWNEITKDPRLWNKVNFHPLCNLVTDEAMLRIAMKNRPLLCHLNLHGCTRLSSDSLKNVSLCQNLQDLNLADIKGINEEVVEQIGRHCNGLFYLNLSNCYITDSIVMILTKHYANLHYLSVAYCQHFTAKGLHSIISGKGCRRLLYLDLSGCTQLTAEGLGFIGKGCCILNTLLLDDLPNLTDGMILKLASHCKTLRHISIMGGSKLSDKAFIFLAMENRKLRCIKIEKNHFMTDASLKIFGMKCRDLSHLFIAGCSRITDNGMKALSRLRKLQVLNIADCNRISDIGVRHIVEGEYREQLKELNLTNLSKISDVTLLRISQNCPALTCLSFCYCEHISDTGVELLGRIPSLSSLDLSGCSIQDEGIQGLRNNPQFRYIMLAELTEITDDGLQRMCSGLTNIDTLDLSYCEQISDKGVEQLTFYCRILRVLYLANCPKLTDASTKCIVKGCSYLSRLDLSACSITDRSLVTVRKSNLRLKRLDILCCAGISREAVMKLQVATGVQVHYNTDQPKFLQHLDTQLLNVPHMSLIDRI